MKEVKKLNKKSLDGIIGGAGIPDSKKIVDFMNPDDPIKKMNRQDKLNHARQVVDMMAGVVSAPNPIKDRHNIKS